ncbi:MAG: hypothetical protein ABIH23_29865 [bacterium]
MSDNDIEMCDAADCIRLAEDNKQEMDKVFVHDADTGYITINIEYPYDIELTRIPDEAALLEWVQHLTEKTWMNTEYLWEFIERIREIKGWSRDHSGPSRESVRKTKGPARFATQFPDIFKCYWGSFGLVVNEFAPHIFENRNRFVRQFAVTSRDERKGLFPFFSYSARLAEIDHPESYRTADKRVILVCSNYNGAPPEVLGMKPYAPMYSKTVRTYVRVFDDYKTASKVIRKWAHTWQ